MTRDTAPSQPSIRRLAVRAGFFGSAFAIFLCGWFAMSTPDWRRIILFSALALVAGALASAFARWSR